MRMAPVMNQISNQDDSHLRQVALVTGATGAIGQAIARGLARHPDFEVVLLGRDEARTRRAAEGIARSTGNPRVRYELADLSRQKEIEALARRWQGPLQVLVNNAADQPPPPPGDARGHRATIRHQRVGLLLADPRL
jgi:NAD(P)-dependent dehydrogenase (short-subunit alcohol dehydrogenase family)